jgi:hypothetical protein
MAHRALARSPIHHWLRSAVHWDGLCSFAELCRRRLRRLLNRLVDVESLRPVKPRKRTYWPEVLQLETRMLPTLTVTGG